MGERPKNAEFVGKVAEIILYPVKGARGIFLQNAEFIHSGVKHLEKNLFDRNFVIIDQYGGSVRSCQESRLTLICCDIKDDYLILEAEGMPPISVPLYMSTDRSNARETKVLGESVEGQDCGDDVADWISKVIGKPGFRLLYGADNLMKRQMNLQEDKWKKNAKDIDIVTFQNGFPLMLASQSSLNKLNSKLSESVEMDRFRPNIVLAGGEAKPFDEDNWKELWIGSLKYTQLKPCNRCPVTIINPRTAVKDANDEPLKTLRTFRLQQEYFGTSPVFGINLVLNNAVGGIIKVGDPVYILRGKITP